MSKKDKGKDKENMKTVKVITVQSVYDLCNREKYFTGGSVDAYNKLFDLVRAKASIDILAAVIWVNSPDSKLAEITIKLQNEVYELEETK